MSQPNIRLSQMDVVTARLPVLWAGANCKDGFKHILQA